MWRLMTIVSLVYAGQAQSSRQESWVASGGFGLSIGALGQTQVLITPQLEQIRTPRLFIGPLIQAAIASSTIFAVSGSIRYAVGNHARIRPSFEAGLGMAFATEVLLGSSVGVLIHMGMGVDYHVDSDLSLGTIFRANIAPPLDSFFLTWPLIVARFTL